MAQFNELSMEMLHMSATNKMVDHQALGNSYSTFNMSKSISGNSLSSSQATHRTQCSSGLSSVSARFANLSSSPNSPDANFACSGSDATEIPVATTVEGKSDSPRSTAPVAGGGKTVLSGVAPSCFGKLRRRARFSGWKEPMYFELRSTALLTFADSKGSGNGRSGGGGGTTSSSGSSIYGLASLAARLMHTRNSTHDGVDWNWSVDLRGATRVVELPGFTKKEKDCFAFAVELSGKEKKKTLVLAAQSAAERKKWMLAVDRARRCVQPKDFEPLSVIGEGHFGKVLLVRWKKGGASPEPSFARSRSSSSVISTGGRHRKQSSSASGGVLGFPSTATIAEEEGKDSSESFADGVTSDEPSAPSSSFRSSMGGGGRFGGSGAGGGRDRFLAVKEVALHKGTSLPGVLNERQILGVLREHPFVVTLRCAWRRGNFLYYGLDFLPGADLFELFRRNSIKMDLQAARVYGGQVALALEHLHKHGICYRDLKPENILVDAKGHLCLADMGLSKILGTGEHAVRTSTVCGTRAYLAPEMVSRKPYGMSVDFWQFGCFIYELYVGHSPFWKPRSGPPGRAHDQTVALILAGEIHYSRFIGPVAKSLISELLDPNVNSRLGCRPVPESCSTRSLSSRGAEVDAPAAASDTPVVETALPVITASSSSSSSCGSWRTGPRRTSSWQSVKEHDFFKDMDWEALLRGEIAAPIKPAEAGRSLVGNFAREYTRQRASWGADQQELRDMNDKDSLFKRELLGFDFVRD